MSPMTVSSTPLSPPMLDVRDLTKTFHANKVAVAALRGIDLAVARGEFVAIMGPSGRGKSTLLHLIAGFERATAGEIRLAGQRADGYDEAAWALIRRRQIGFVFQFFNLLADLTVADNVELRALLAGATGGEAKRRRLALLDELAIAETARAYPAELSGGQQQRVALARALINAPDLLLADEPTGNLDSAGARDVLTAIRARHAAGQTIIMVTHDARVASQADRVVSMRDGAIVDQSRLTNGGDPRRTLAALMSLEA